MAIPGYEQQAQLGSLGGTQQPVTAPRAQYQAAPAQAPAVTSSGFGAATPMGSTTVKPRLDPADLQQRAGQMRATQTMLGSRPGYAPQGQVQPAAHPLYGDALQAMLQAQQAQPQMAAQSYQPAAYQLAPRPQIQSSGFGVAVPMNATLAKPRGY